jgi:hypothetical protein
MRSSERSRDCVGLAPLSVETGFDTMPNQSAPSSCYAVLSKLRPGNGGGCKGGQKLQPWFCLLQDTCPLSACEIDICEYILMNALIHAFMETLVDT